MQRHRRCATHKQVHWPRTWKLHRNMDEDADTGPNPIGNRRGQRSTVRLGDEIIVSNLELADTMWRRMRGLLGRDSLAPSAGLWIVPCPSIHMFFMRFPIDAIFLDADLRVVRVFEDLQPWRMARGGRSAKTVLELPSGKVATFNIRVGDRLVIE